MTTEMEAKMRRALEAKIYPMEQVLFKICIDEIGGSLFGKKAEGFMDLLLGGAAASVGAGTSAIALTSKRFVRLKKFNLGNLPPERTSLFWKDMEKIEIKKDPIQNPTSVSFRIYMKNKTTVDVYVIKNGVKQVLELYERTEDVLKMI